MDQLMRANMQIIELLGAVFEEVERKEMRATPRRHQRPSPLRCWVGQPKATDDAPPARAQTN